MLFAEPKYTLLFTIYTYYFILYYSPSSDCLFVNSTLALIQPFLCKKVYYSCKALILLILCFYTGIYLFAITTLYFAVLYD